MTTVKKDTKKHDRMVAAILFDAYRDAMGSVLTDLGIKLPEKQKRKAIRLAREVLVSAREWRWQVVEAGLDKLYAIVGGTNPGTGYAFHLGCHPVQLVYRELEDELDPDWED